MSVMKEDIEKNKRNLVYYFRLVGFNSIAFEG